MMRSRQHVEASARTNAGWVPAGENRIVARVLGDMKLVLDTRDFSLTPHLAMDGFWESWITMWFANNLEPADQLLNIGANCGYYAILAAKRGIKHVVAVEPQKSLADNIRLSASLNGCSVEVIECVAGDTEREVHLHLFGDMMGSAFAMAHPTPLGNTCVEMKEIQAHKLCETATIAFVDAEGYEPHIWNGLRPLLDQRQLRWVALEWAPSRYKDAAGLLRSLGEYGPLSVINDKGGEQPAPSAQALLNGSEWETLVVRRGD